MDIPCNLVFFTEPDLIPTFTIWRGAHMDKTIFIPFDFMNDSVAFKRYGRDFWKRQFTLDKENLHTPELYAVWYEKKEFVLKAIAANHFPDATKYIWADAGGFRVPEWFPKIQAFPLAEKIPDNKFFLLEMEPFSKDPRGTSAVTVGAGYLAAHKDIWPNYSEKYDAMLTEYVAEGYFVGKEQTLMGSMYLKEPEFFELVPTDKNSADAWFWPQLYFSSPMITIIIPLYNGIEFLPISLSSIFKQTYTEYKVLIAVNGHEEDSPIFFEVNRIVTTLEEQYHKQAVTTILHLTTHGKPASMNKAVESVKTEWVAILDVDDIWLPNKLETQVAVCASYDVIGTHTQYFGNMTGTPNIPVGDISEFDFFSVNPIINSSALLRTQLLKYDVAETTGLEDYELWIRLWKAKVRFFNIPEILVGHRIHAASAFNNTNSRYLEKFLERMGKS